MSGISHISNDGSSYSFRGAGNTRITVHLEGDKNAPGQETKKTAVPGQDLSKEEEAQVAELRRIDAKVRAHEMAHLAASGGYATSGAKFEYTVGPDGKSYAVGGEVSIDTSPVRGDPEATIAKARTIQAAALAPAEPSGADRAVAASAAQMAAQAAQQLARQEHAEQNGEVDPVTGEAPKVGESKSERAGATDDAREAENGSMATARAQSLFGIAEPERTGGSLDITA